MLHYYSIRLSKTWWIFQDLSSTGVDSKDLYQVQNLYYIQSADLNSEVSRFFNIEKGARQGCVLSPDLFNLHTESISRSVLEMEGVCLNGENIINIRYNDDAVLWHSLWRNNVKFSLVGFNDAFNTKGYISFHAKGVYR